MNHHLSSPLREKELDFMLSLFIDVKRLGDYFLLDLIAFIFNFANFRSRREKKVVKKWQS
jgi:hypothetical protein